jgi:2-succinyl-5-enolpyruvyl-6-hydroxy-3-cyclohexene-1-carboxylate synthase
MDIQPIFELAHLCHLKGITNAIISPGSRNAALTFAFTRHPDINCYSVPDERSAAFMALGMSLKTNMPTALICTSGSAVLNYSPAVAEAFFNQVPLLLLSADRPPEWIDQKDGQTIYQENVFGKHVKRSFNFPVIENKEAFQQANRMANEAINTTISGTPGPVHINIPFREPFYPEDNRTYTYPASTKIIALNASQFGLTEQAINQNAFKNKKILIVTGQNKFDHPLTQSLSVLSQKHKIPIVGDIISNSHDIYTVIKHQDVFLKNNDDQKLRPDLLITTGQSVISKSLKEFLRNNPPEEHWHIGTDQIVADTFQCLTQSIQSSPVSFFDHMESQLKSSSLQTAFYNHWIYKNHLVRKLLRVSDNSVFTELDCYKKILSELPDHIDLHLANSMAVRYANVIGLHEKKSVEVFCNRGTSGIDGSNSTAVGAALMTDRQTVLLTGDVAFLYDRNAFWHHHLPDNLHIIVFNNKGGGIFRMIDGPSAQPELETYFETKHDRNAALVAKEFDFKYLPCHNEAMLETNLADFTDFGNKRKILEIFTNQGDNKTAYKELFKKVMAKMK